MTSEAEVIPPKTSPWKSLLGFLSEPQAMEAVRLPWQPTEPALEQKIHDAIEYVHNMQSPRELTPQLREIPAELFTARETKLRSEPTFAEHLAGINESTFQMVEISKLRAFQPNLNMEFVERLKTRAPKPGDAEGLLRFCLPLRDEMAKRPVITSFNPVTSTFTVASENLDMRIVGNVNGQDPATGRQFFGFAFGLGLPQMSVVRYKDAYMVKNGYHRAAALLEAGHEFMPCLLLRTDNYQATGAAAPGFFPFDVVLSAKPPMLSDFQTPAAVVYQRALIRMILTIHAEIQPTTV